MQANTCNTVAAASSYQLSTCRQELLKRADPLWPVIIKIKITNNLFMKKSQRCRLQRSEKATMISKMLWMWDYRQNNKKQCKHSREIMNAHAHSSKIYSRSFKDHNRTQSCLKTSRRPNSKHSVKRSYKLFNSRLICKAVREGICCRTIDQNQGQSHQDAEIT